MLQYRALRSLLSNRIPCGHYMFFHALIPSPFKWIDRGMDLTTMKRAVGFLCFSRNSVREDATIGKLPRHKIRSGHSRSPLGQFLSIVIGGPEAKTTTQSAPAALIDKFEGRPRNASKRENSSDSVLKAFPKTDRNHQPKRTSSRFDRINQGSMPHG